MNDHENWWWPADDGYWPHGIPKMCNMQNFILAYKMKGYRPCRSKRYVHGYEKIVIYKDKNGVPTHAAFQSLNGRWKSKLGKLEDIQHDMLESISNDGYGIPFQTLRRRNREAISMIDRIKSIYYEFILRR